ncbi:hypothetical protein BZ425_13975 [Salmonella enterica subsp. enterica serovar Enteritidis]|nr:hypothetical protein [Salmonella enterica subsp. enterica serovar Enteritidis]
MVWSEQLIDVCRDPFTLWLLCSLRRDDRFYTFIKDPQALSNHVKREETRLETLKEESNTLEPTDAFYVRMMSSTWRKTHRLKAPTLADMVQELARAVSSDHLLYRNIIQQPDSWHDLRLMLIRCQFTFS